MKLKSLFTALVCLLSGMATYANNIQVSNVSLTGWNSANDFTMVKFNLSWENSWRTSSTPSNWDAAWVFVKYRVNGGEWNHARLNDNGHQAATGSTVQVGLVNPSASFNASTIRVPVLLFIVLPMVQVMYRTTIFNYVGTTVKTV